MRKIGLTSESYEQDHILIAFLFLFLDEIN